LTFSSSLKENCPRDTIGDAHNPYLIEQLPEITALK
jgi:hypothetical protein